MFGRRHAEMGPCVGVGYCRGVSLDVR
jgi:hypothetical protein